MALHPDSAEQRKDQHGELGTHGYGLVSSEWCLNGVKRGKRVWSVSQPRENARNRHCFLPCDARVCKYVAEDSGEGAGGGKDSSCHT